MIIDFEFIKPLFDTFLDEHFSEFFKLFDKENDFKKFKPHQAYSPIKGELNKTGFVENEGKLIELLGYVEGNPFLLWYQKKIFFIQLSNLNSFNYYKEYEPRPKDNNVKKFCKEICLKSFNLVMESDYYMLEILSLKHKSLKSEIIEKLKRNRIKPEKLEIYKTIIDKIAEAKSKGFQPNTQSICRKINKDAIYDLRKAFDQWKRNNKPFFNQLMEDAKLKWEMEK